MKDAKKDFFILTAPRSGSTVLARTLDQHPQLFCAGELFHHSGKIYHPEWHFPFVGVKKKKGFSRVIFALTNYIKGYFSGVNHIKRFYSKDNTEELRGFKLMISHIKDFPTVWKYLHANDLKIIVLIRENTFREALSSFRAKKTGIFHSSEELAAVNKKLNVNAMHLEKRVDELEAINKNILRLSEGTNRIIITYEEFENWQQMLDKVFDFLGVTKINIQPGLKRTSTANWREGVENYEEIESRMKDKYAQYLN